jgi:hypothetical protein
MRALCLRATKHCTTGLVTLGYSVVTRLDSAPVDYSGIDVIVTGSITGSNINGKYANPDVGVVCVDSWPHFGLGDQIGFQNSVTDVEVINDSSPLAGGLSSGIHTVYGTAGYLVWSTNYNSATAVVAAVNPGNPTQPIVFGYEAGSAMQGGYATTRHVGLGLHLNVRANMTASGWALFDAAVAWAAASAYVAPPPPSAPTNLSATAGDMQVSLSWNSVAGATSYSVKRSTVSGGPYSTIVSGHTTTSYIDSSLTNGSTYYYVVSASNAEGESSNSTQVSAVPVEGSGTGGSDRFLYSDAQIAEFQNRMSGAGPFYSLGQGFDGPQTNAPADGERALSLANTYITNPSQYTFIQTFNNGTSLEPNDPWPGTGYIHNMRAAWCYMTMPTHPNNSAWRNAARDQLLIVANHPNHDFANSNMYKDTYPGFQPSPIFATAGGMIRNLKTYDMLGRDVFTTSELALLDKWFYSYANWILHQHEQEVNNGKIPLLTSGSTDPASGSGFRSEVPYNGGPNISSFGMYTNRQMKCLESGIYIANYLKYHNVSPPTSGGSQPSYGWWTIDEMLDYGRYNVSAWLRLSLHPSGFTYDFHRGQLDGTPTQGWAYASNEIQGPVMIAKVYARRGDNTLWDDSTTLGYNNTAGSPNNTSGVSGFPEKNIHFAQWMLSRYANNGWGRLLTAGGSTAALVPSNVYRDVIPAAVVSSKYPQDELLSSAWRRSGNNFPGYPSSAQNQGSFNGFDGEMATFLGLIEVAPT